jgi:hypothetical protein
MKYHGTFRGQGPDRPLLTVDTRDRFAEVRAFLTKFYGIGDGGAARPPDADRHGQAVTTSASSSSRASPTRSSTSA